MKVLIVDNESALRALLEMLLGELGLTDTISASNGRDALRLLTRERDGPDLIICEWSLPRMGGMELLRACSQDPALKEIPFVIMLSEGEVESKILEATEAGAAACLVKPFSPEELEAVLKRVGLMPEP
jgi:CheY-like chemotaxis protein